MENNQCSKTDKFCWYGFKKETCPKKRFENERLFYGFLIVLLVTLVLKLV